jgi:polynucleotide 5'-hydroxyl-kinase GRC3/NOL9
VRIKLQSGHELLVHGPATTRLVSGNASSLAKQLLEGEPLTVRAGRLSIIEAAEESELDLIIGQSGKIEEVETSTIPPDWAALAKKMTTERTSQRIMILGGPDTGKNTLITYLSNTLLRVGLKVAIMDADMGQSEIGPPTTMSVTFLENPIFELLEAEPNSMFFVGSTSPAFVVGRVLEGTEKLMNSLNGNYEEAILLVNMPGWINGQGATDFVLQMISKTNASHLIALQRENEVEDILKEVTPRVQSIKLTASPYARPRTREERKFLRETSYRKYFAGLREITMHYGEIDFSPLFSTCGKEASLKVVREVENIVRNRVLYCEERNSSINAIVVGRVGVRTEILDEITAEQQDNGTGHEIDVERETQKEIRVIPISELENIIVALFDENEQLISLGMLKNLDFRAKRATVSAISKPSQLSRIEVGKVKISRQGHEIGYAEIRKVLSVDEQPRGVELENESVRH